jgi:hypothetical protein
MLSILKQYFIEVSKARHFRNPNGHVVVLCGPQRLIKISRLLQDGPPE